MNIPKIKELLGYPVIEQKEGFVSLPVEDFEKIEAALIIPVVEEQAPAVEEKTPVEKKPTKTVEPTHGDNYPYYS